MYDFCDNDNCDGYRNPEKKYKCLKQKRILHITITLKL